MEGRVRLCIAVSPTNFQYTPVQPPTSKAAKSLKRVQKLHVMTKECLSEIQNLGKPKNSSTLIGVFASRKREYVAKMARAL